MITTLCPGLIDLLCISIVAVPYSSSYSTETVSQGSFPFFSDRDKWLMQVIRNWNSKNKSSGFRSYNHIKFYVFFNFFPASDLLQTVTPLHPEECLLHSLNIIPGSGKSGMLLTYSSIAFMILSPFLSKIQL